MQRLQKIFNFPQLRRAVGTAIANNPVAFLIPCHRVIKSTGLSVTITGEAHENRPCSDGKLRNPWRINPISGPQEPGRDFFYCLAILLYKKIKKMKKFKIVPLSKEYATKIRTTRKDDFGHEVIEQIATGLGPCRVSLKPFKRGEDKRLLLTHSPFPIDNPSINPDRFSFIRLKWTNTATYIIFRLK